MSDIAGNWEDDTRTRMESKLEKETESMAHNERMAEDEPMQVLMIHLHTINN